MSKKNEMPTVPCTNSFPTFTIECQDCHKEYIITGTYEEADNSVCPLCSSKNVKQLYITFPVNESSYQNDYDAGHITGGHSMNGQKDSSYTCSAHDCSDCDAKN